MTETKEKSIQEQLDMKIEDLLTYLENLYLPLEKDSDPNIDLLVSRRLKQHRYKFGDQNKRISTLVGEIDSDDSDDNKDYGSDEDDEGDESE